MTIFFFDRAGNTVGKVENAGYQHFLLCPQCFPKLSGLCGKELDDLEKEAFWKHCRKRRKCWKPALSSFPTRFSILPKNKFQYSCNIYLAVWSAFNLDLSKNLLFGWELNILPHDKISDLSKFKTHKDDKLRLAKMMKLAFNCVEKWWEKKTSGPWWPCIAPLADI